MGALQNLEKGKVLTAIMDVVNSVEAEIGVLEAKYPWLGTFIDQFRTDVGTAVLSEINTLKAAGNLTFSVDTALQIAEAAAKQAGVDVTDEIKTLALNGLRAATTVVAQPASDAASDGTGEADETTANQAGG